MYNNHVNDEYNYTNHDYFPIPVTKKRMHSKKDESFICRVCGNEYDFALGDVFILICDYCAQDYDIVQIWEDFERKNLSEEELRDIDLEEYRL